MSIKPILFNTDMVQAILDDRKTVTRRVIKGVSDKVLLGECVDGDKKDIGKVGFGTHEWGGEITYIKPPYQPGDNIYVREAFVQPAAHVFWYRATPPKGCENILWKPSIRMPKEAARIWMKVTDVRVKRLQDMTEQQAKAEGFEPIMSTKKLSFCTPWQAPPVENFRYFWDSTIKKKDLPLYGWDANPWVWVIEFERTVKPECI